MANLKRGPVQGKAEISDVNSKSKNVKAYQKLDVGFIVDRPGNQQTVRALILVDTYTRSCLGLKLETSLGSGGGYKSAWQTDRGAGMSGENVLDSSPEFTSRQIRAGQKGGTSS
jgi:hypothetical protein